MGNTSKNSDKIFKTKEYITKLIEHNYIDGKTLNEKTMNDLMSKISSIISQYEYELYKNNVDSDLTATQFELQPFELFDLLQSKSDHEFSLMIRHFSTAKFHKHEKFFEGKDLSLSKAKYLTDRHHELKAIRNSAGLWDFQGNLVYGLWHNTMFLKMGRSTYSKKYELRIINALLDQSNSKIIIDLDWSAGLNYLKMKTLATQIRVLLSYNKYKTLFPYTIEFFNSKPMSYKFEALMSRGIPQWSTTEVSPYVRYQENIQNVYHPKRLYYITPNARKVLKISELANPDNIMVLPAFITKSLKDPLYTKVNSLNTVHVRRLPTIENLIWNKFHGVLSLNTVFSVIHDMRYITEETWSSVFRKYLSEELIKQPEELDNIEKYRLDRIAKKQKAIQRFKENSTKSYYKSYTVKFDIEKYKKLKSSVKKV